MDRRVHRVPFRHRGDPYLEYLAWIYIEFSTRNQFRNWRGNGSSIGNLIFGKDGIDGIVIFVHEVDLGWDDQNSSKKQDLIGCFFVLFARYAHNIITIRFKIPVILLPHTFDFGSRSANQAFLPKPTMAGNRKQWFFLDHLSEHTIVSTTSRQAWGSQSTEWFCKDATRTRLVFPWFRHISCSSDAQELTSLALLVLRKLKYSDLLPVRNSGRVPRKWWMNWRMPGSTLVLRYEVKTRR